MRVVRVVLLHIVGLALFAAGCSSGEQVSSNVTNANNTNTNNPEDARVVSDGDVEQDAGGVDLPTPPVEAGPPCGNGRLDPGEECDPAAIGAEACPTSCDDTNHCTEDSLIGSAEECTAVCRHRTVKPCCGNGVVETGEQCDDSNSNAEDTCNANCALPGGHLLLSEVAVSPTGAEFIELYNPTVDSVSLENVYLTDRVDYYQITTNVLGGVASDFVARFPAGAQIAGDSYLVVAFDGLAFATAFGSDADYEIKGTTDGTPDMVAATEKSIGGSCGLTDSGEMLMLFRWDGSTDRVEDIDYVAWKDGALVYKSKTDCVDGIDPDEMASCYVDDTPEPSQAGIDAPGTDGSIHRCNFVEGNEEKQGGNGVLDHDETSEDFPSTWKRNASTAADRTPGEPAPAGLCP